MPIELRGEQQKNVDELRAEVMAGRHPVLVAPCGYGKGTLITYIVQRAVANGHEVIFGVRGKSLVEDMSQRLKRLGLEHGVLMGERKRERWHPVQVASIDTLYRMETPPGAALVIVDEAHMSLSRTWRLALSRIPGAMVIGMTATPIGPGGKGLGRASGGLFDSMVRGPSVKKLIQDGYLVRSRVLEPPAVEGAKEVRLGTTDNLGAQAAVFDRPKLIGDEIRHYKEHAAGRKGVTFCSSQAHAYHMAEEFTRAGIPWAYVDADTSLDDRDAIYHDLDTDSGTLMGVASVGCVSIGWDHPIVSYLGIMRRTQSFGLWHQMMGRGSRICPAINKKDFLIIDHAGNSKEHEPYGYFESEIPWQLDSRIEPKPTDGLRTCHVSVKDCDCDDPKAQHTDNWDEIDGDWVDAGSGSGEMHLACYGTFPKFPILEACPWCHCPLIPKARNLIPDHEDGNLTEKERPEIIPLGIRAAQMFRDLIASRGGAKQQDQFQWLLTEASRRGYKAGWARHQFIAKFGEPPPVEWMPREWRESHQQ